MSRSGLYDRDLDRNPANYTPLTPLSLIARTAYTYPNRLSVIHADRRYTWAETYARSRRLASALVGAGVGRGDTVAVMASNTPEMVELHFGVPMAGGVLNTLNTRLDAETIAFMLKHAQAKALVTDTEFAPIVEAALRRRSPSLVLDVDPLGPGGKRLGKIDYEAFIAAGDPEFEWQHPDDEWNAISLNPVGDDRESEASSHHHRARI